MLKPWLWLPTSLAHSISPHALNLVSPLLKAKKLPWKSTEWRGLKFANPLGIAGGVDKTGYCLNSWWKLGVGFIEIGTVTPKAQSPNPGKIMDRDIARKALWNKMGFPNKGVAPLKKRLQKMKKPHYTPVFINIGKNRDTPLEKAHDDYIYCIKELAEFADTFVVNISSPNTKGLRQLFEEEHFKRFLKPIIEYNKTAGGNPLLLKLSPDLSSEDLSTVLKVSADLNIDGWIFTNTTVDRAPNTKFPAEGGVSGLPIAEKSKTFLKNSLEFLGEQRKGKLIISCGGIMNAHDAFERLEIGADLVQVYSVLVFNGPGFFSSVAKEAVKQ